MSEEIKTELNEDETVCPRFPFKTDPNLRLILRNPTNFLGG